MTPPLAHAGHYLGYGFAIVGILALASYDWLRRHRRS